MPYALPTTLPARPVLPDPEVIEKQEGVFEGSVGRLATPTDTPIFICTLNGCNRLYPSRERLGMHRRKDHASEDLSNHLLTWDV